MVQVAVTGASGHIGSNLCRRLVEAGYAVRAQYLSSGRPLEDIPVEMVRGDVRDREFARDFVRGSELVFHLAARISIAGDPTGDVWQTNVDGTRCVAEACLAARVRRLIHFSSIHAFEQRPREKPLDEQRGPVGPSAFVYDRSKVGGEDVIRDAVSRGLDAVILNPTAVIGPEDHRPSHMGKVLMALADGRMPVIVDGGFDWVDVRDVVDAAIAAVDRGRTGERYLLSGEWASLMAVAHHVDAAVNRRRVRLVLPVWVARPFVPVVGLVARLAGSPPVFTNESLAIVAEGNRAIRHDLATRELGFRPRPLKQTVEDTIRYFMNDTS